MIGRDAELAVAREHLLADDVRLLTLTGPAGVGKTRLATAVAEAAAPAFPDGCWFVDLAPIADPAAVMLAVALALGIRETGVRNAAGRVAAYLRDARVLLVLDNFEQVVPASAALAALLARCPGVTALVTSRERLRVRWEHVLPVEPLAVPDPREAPDVSRLANVPAVALFVRRARASDGRFALTAENAADAAELCRRLDGLPLAIELAAARVALLPPAEMLARMEDRLDWLRWDAHDLPGRHRALRAAVAWSYDLLDDAERQVFASLATFVGGWTLEAAEAVGGGLDALGSLVDKSLARTVSSSDEPRRFAMLETIREYALERLVAEGEAERGRRRHADYFLDLAERGARELTGPDQRRWLDRLEAEHDNLRAALRWSLARRAVLALRLACALSLFWFIRGHFEEGSRWLEEALARTTDGPPSLRARALDGLGRLAHRQGDYERARALHEEALRLARELEDRPLAGYALLHLGMVARYQGLDDDAASLLEQALSVARELGEEWVAGCACMFLGPVARDAGDEVRAVALAEQGLAHFRALGDDRCIAMMLADLAELAARRGEVARMADLLRESLTHALDLGDWRPIAYCADVAAILLAEHGAPERAARLVGLTDLLRHLATADRLPASRATYERVTERLRARLGAVTFEAARREGYATPHAAAGAVLLATIDASAASPAHGTGEPAANGSSGHPRLSGREREVLRLVADGGSNKLIARALGITEHTVQFHVAAIRDKLAADTRAQAVALATRLGIL